MLLHKFGDHVPHYGIPRLIQLFKLIDDDKNGVDDNKYIKQSKLLVAYLNEENKNKANSTTAIMPPHSDGSPEQAKSDRSFGLGKKRKADEFHWV